MADPNYANLSPEQKAVVDAAVEWRAAELNVLQPSGLREAAPDGGDRDAHAERRSNGAQMRLRAAVGTYNAL